MQIWNARNFHYRWLFRSLLWCAIMYICIWINTKFAYMQFVCKVQSNLNKSLLYEQETATKKSLQKMSLKEIPVLLLMSGHDGFFVKLHKVLGITMPFDFFVFDLGRKLKAIRKTFLCILKNCISYFFLELLF